MLPTNANSFSGLNAAGSPDWRRPTAGKVKGIRILMGYLLRMEKKNGVNLNKPSALNPKPIREPYRKPTKSLIFASTSKTQGQSAQRGGWQDPGIQPFPQGHSGTKQWLLNSKSLGTAVPALKLYYQRIKIHQVENGCSSTKVVLPKNGIHQVAGNDRSSIKVALPENAV